MRVRIFFSALIAAFFSVTALAQPSSAANELAQRLSTYKTYQANFKQVTYSNGDQQNSSGKLYMQRPGKFRWEVNKPNAQIIIANSKTLWVYDIELEQVTKETINGQSMNNPAVLLSGDVSQLIKQYDVSKVQKDRKTWYQLKSRSTRSNFLLVRMRFSNNHLVAVWVKNNLGQTSIFQFSNIQLNRPLKYALFNFKPPPGVDVLQ